jgi:hypothetical protein
MDSGSKSLHLQPVTPAHRVAPMRADNGSQKVGCPIRKFPDQSLFAAPRDLSQRTTSFIASQRQGIRQIPFWHLIHARNQKTDDRASRPSRVFRSKRPVLLQTHPGSLRSGEDHDWYALETSSADGLRQGLAPSPNPTRRLLPRPDALPLHDVNVGAANPQGSAAAFENRRSRRASPPRPGSSILKLMFHRKPRRLRAARLSTGPPAVPLLVEPDGIEPTTSCLQSTRSPN